VETFRNNRQLLHRTWQSIHPEPIGRSEDGQTVERVIPEIAILLELLERAQNTPRIERRIILPKRLLQRFEKIAKANRVLLIARVMPTRRLIERETGRLRVVENAGGVIVKK